MKLMGDIDEPPVHSDEGFVQAKFEDYLHAVGDQTVARLRRRATRIAAQAGAHGADMREALFHRLIAIEAAKEAAMERGPPFTLIFFIALKHAKIYVQSKHHGTYRVILLECLNRTIARIGNRL